MKKLYYISLVLLTAGCQVIPEDSGSLIDNDYSLQAGQRSIVVEATEATKAYLVEAGESYSMLWDSGDKAALLERNNVNSSVARYNSSSVALTSGGASASFSFTGIDPVGGASSYNYDLLFPSSAVGSVSGTVVSLTVPSVQTPESSTVDKGATLLYGRAATSYSEQPSHLGVSFNHLVAYSKINLKNLNLAAGETLESIAITAEGCDIAGEVLYDVSDWSVSYSADDISTITIQGDNLVADPSGFDVWFACKPFTLSKGKRFTVVTTTSLFTRTATLTAKIDMEFEAGKVTEFPARPDDYAVTGDVWYISPSGSDDNDGASPGTPVKTFDKVLSLIDAGDQVRIMPGTFKSNWDDILKIDSEKSGTAGNYISFVAHNPASRPVFHITGKAAWNAINCNASYIVFDGIEVKGDNDKLALSDAEDFADACWAAGKVSDWNTAALYNANGISIGGTGTKSSGPHHIVIRNCVVHDLPGAGIAAIQADYITVENNEVYNCAWLTFYACSGISFLNPLNSDGETGYKMIVRGNKVSNCYTGVKWIRFGSSYDYSDGNGIIIDTNKTPDSTSGSVTNGQGEYTGRTLVENNVSFYNGGSGIHTYKANHVDIVGNTAYYNGRMYNGSYGEIWGNQSDDVHIWNNIMCGGRDAASSMCNLGDSDVVYTNNIYWQGTVTHTGTGDIVADPLFVNASTDRTVADFHLSAGSPAIGHGASLSYSPSRDHDGKLRGGSFDCGAYQY